MTPLGVRDNGSVQRFRSVGDQAMPLSEEEQRILREIEAQLTATDPGLAQQVSETTIYRHSARAIRWALLGFFAGLALMLLTFTRTWILGAAGFLVMLACTLVVVENVRKMGRAGIESLTSSVRAGSLRNLLAGSRWRDRFRRDDPG